MTTTSSYESLLEDVPCNLCGSNDYKVIYPPRYEKAKPDEIMESFRSSGDEILIDQLVQCNHCGLKYLTPRLKQETIIQAYSSGEDNTFISQIESRERTFDKSLEKIEKLLPQKGKVFDVGTAGGSFLGVAKRRGWQVEGCEPSRWLSEWGSKNYGINIHPGTIFDAQLQDNSYDLVTLWDVLEHTPDPKAVLMECFRILKPGGLLVVNYPDMNSLIGKLMGRRYVFLLSVHLYYFSVDTIKDILQKSGFRMLKHEWHWQTLQIGYVFFRAKAYVPLLGSLGEKIVSALKMDKLHISYWMGQVLVIAKKN